MSKPAWALSLLPPALSLVTLRIYLGYFDNASLFTENLSLASILNAVFIFLTITFTLIVFIFSVPSVFVAALIPRQSQKIHNYEEIKTSACRGFLLSLVTFFLTFFGAVYISEKHPACETALLLSTIFFNITVLFVINFCFIRKPLKITQEYQTKKSHQKTARTLYLFLPSFTLIVILMFSFPVGMVLDWINGDVAGGSLAMFAKITSTAMLAGIVSVLPGLLYVRGNTGRSFLSVAAVVIILPLLLSMYVPSFFPVVIDKTMSAAGVADWQLRHYQIDENKYSIVHFSNPDWQATPVVSGKKFVVKGIMVYSLNGIRLLCPEPLIKHYRNMLHFVPWDRSYDKAMTAEMKLKSSRCQPFIQGGIERLADE